MRTMRTIQYDGRKLWRIWKFKKKNKLGKSTVKVFFLCGALKKEHTHTQRSIHRHRRIFSSKLIIYKKTWRRGSFVLKIDPSDGEKTSQQQQGKKGICCAVLNIAYDRHRRTQTHTKKTDVADVYFCKNSVTKMMQIITYFLPSIPAIRMTSHSCWLSK